MHTDVIDRPMQLVRVASDAGLTENHAAPIIDAFRPHFAEAQDLISQAAGVTVTDATQVAAMQESRTLRLKIRAVRVEADKTRKTLKEDSLRMGKAIDGMNNVLLAAIVPVEQRLQEQEEYALRIDTQRRAALVEARRTMLAPYTAQVPDGVTLAGMTEDVFSAMLNGLRLAFERQIEEARKAEEARAEAEKARAAEEARIRLENQRLAREAEERERQMRAEREVAEAKLKAEREAREKLEREAKAKAAAEAKAKADADKARKKAERAPDADKLRAIAGALKAIPTPDAKTEAGKRSVLLVSRWVAELVKDIQAEAQDLEDGIVRPQA